MTRAAVSIRARLLLLVLSIAIPSGAAALWMIGHTYAVEREALQRNLQDTTRGLSDALERELERRASIARALGQSRLLDAGADLAGPALEGFEQQARRAMEGLDGWVELHSADRRVLSTAPPGRTIDVAARAVPAPLLQAPRFGPMVRDPATGELRASVVQPVQRDGRTVLNLAVTILPGELQQLLESQRLPSERVAVLLDPAGEVAARRSAAPLPALDGLPARLKATLAERRSAAFDDVPLDGVSYSGYFDTSAQGWTAVTGMPRARFAESVPRQVWLVALAAAALLGSAVLGALRVARSIEQPVGSLKEAATRLQAGLPVDASPTGIAECDEVASALAEASRSLRHAREELEYQVDQAVTQTRQAEQRASQSRRVEALGRLTGGFAHDFNNLLGVISNSAHLIQRHAADQPELRTPITATLRAVEAGSRLTENLLRFAGRKPVQPKAVDLRRCIADLQELLASVLGPRVELAVEVADGTPPINVDASELELALLNLALNAREAVRGRQGGRGHVWIEARAAQDDDTDGLPALDYTLLAFSDDGAGIDASIAEHVFEPFVTTKPVGQGAGLGLSQVHGFCTQAGGTVRLASTPGHGTTVTLLLPAAAQGETMQQPPAANISRDLAGRRVLLVEDHDQLGDVTMGLLETYGSEVTRVATAADALEVLESGATFDVVLSDIVMPGAMDGLMLARVVRTRWPDLAMVLNTGYTSAHIAARDFHVLRKPCTPEALVDALQSAIERRGERVA